MTYLSTLERVWEVSTKTDVLYTYLGTVSKAQVHVHEDVYRSQHFGEGMGNKCQNRGAMYVQCTCT